MAQIVSKHLSNMEFSYESDAAASFLVIKSNAEVLEYQALMLSHNHIRHVIPVDVIRKEGVTCFFYNITSKISLEFYLSRQKFNRDEFLRLLLHITSAVNNSAGYLLEDSNFIFNPEYIYINPETMEPALIYFPAPLEDGSGTQLTGFVSDLLLHHINADGFGSGNFVQRILASIKSEVFNTKAFIALLSELLYVQDTKEQHVTLEEHEMHEMQNKKDMMDRNYKKDKKNREHMYGRKDPDMPVGNKKEAKCDKNNNGKRTQYFSLFALLIQIVMGGVIFLCRDFLNNIGDNPTTTYVAVGMIVLAVEVLLFKRLNAAKLINLNAAKECSAIDEQKEIARLDDNANIVCPKNYDHSNSLNYGKISEEASDSTAAQANTPSRASCKTELLGCYVKGVRFLKSTGNQKDDEDIFIDKDDFIIGRLTGYVDYVLMNNAVGKLHAQLTYKNDTCYVKDLNSVNGTFINNKRIESNKDFELKSNDKLQLANSEFIFINE